MILMDVGGGTEKSSCSSCKAQLQLQCCSDFKAQTLLSPDTSAAFTSKALGCPPLEKHRWDPDHTRSDSPPGH